MRPQIYDGGDGAGPVYILASPYLNAQTNGARGGGIHYTCALNASFELHVLPSASLWGMGWCNCTLRKFFVCKILVCSAWRGSWPPPAT